MIPTFTKSYKASADIDAYLIVAFSDAANASTVAPAAAATDPLVGTSDKMGADSGGMCDVERGGIASVQLGGTVEAGDPLTSDANGKAIKAEPGAGTTMRIVGWADQPGVADDIIDYFCAPGQLTGV